MAGTQSVSYKWTVGRFACSLQLCVLEANPLIRKLFLQCMACFVLGLTLCGESWLLGLLDAYFQENCSKEQVFYHLVILMWREKTAPSSLHQKIR